MAEFTPGQIVTASELEVLSPVGLIAPYAGPAVPTGWLACDGAAVSRTTYAALFDALCPSKGTVTVTIASPAVFTRAAHGLVAGDAVFLTTTGALPTGLTANTTYYVIAAGLTADAFQVSTTRGGAAVNTSGTQSGTHTLFRAPWGVAASTTFNLPDLRGRTVAGHAVSGGHADNAVIGLDDGLALANRRMKHKHTVVVDGARAPSSTGTFSYAGTNAGLVAPGADVTVTVGPQTGAEPIDTVAHIVVPWIIRATYS